MPPPSLLAFLPPAPARLHPITLPLLCRIRPRPTCRVVYASAVPSPVPPETPSPSSSSSSSSSSSPSSPPSSSSSINTTSSTVVTANSDATIAVNSSPSDELIVSRLLLCTQRMDWSTADSDYTAYIAQHIPTKRVLGSYVRALCRQGRLDEARDHLNMYPIADSAVARASFIGAIARRDGADAAHTELLSCDRCFWSPHAVTAVMHAYGLELRPQETAKLLRSADEAGVELDVQMFNSLIRVLGRVGRLRDALLVMRQVRLRQLTPTDCTFEGLIYACAHTYSDQGHATAQSFGKRALVIYDAAEAEGLNSPRVLSALASAILRCDLFMDERVEKLLDGMARALKMSYNDLRRLGVNKDRFALKHANIARRRQVRMEKSHRDGHDHDDCDRDG